MRMIMIALGALIVLGGGGAGAYFYFMQPAEASAGEHATETVKEDHGKKDSHNEHYEFVELDPLVLPIVDKDGVSQVVSLVIAIEVEDAEAKTRVESLTPRLKDAYIQDMYGVLNKHAALKGGVIQVSMLKDRLHKISTHVLGEDGFSDVLLQVVQQRPM